MANRFEQMRAFAGVVEAGGFTSATERTGMSRAVVSRNILDLEDRLGTRLLNRTTRQVSLTEAGRLFYEKCRRILDEVAEAELSAMDKTAGPQGELRVVAPVNFGLAELGPAITEFLLAYKDIRINLSLNDRPIDPIESGYDVAIRVSQNEPLLPMTLDMFEITQSSRIICASPAYLTEHGEPHEPDDLTSHSCLCYSYVDEPAVWQLARAGINHSIRVNSRVTTSAGSVLTTSAIRCLGIAYGPVAFFRDAIEAGDLQRVLPDYELPKVTIYSLFARNKHVPPKVEAFNAFTKEYFTLHPHGYGMS